MMKKFYLLGILLSHMIQGVAQRMTQKLYIERYAPIAIKEKDRTGIPASITMAQGILESESGNSELALKSNNHFGIKCKETWQGEKVYHDDDARGECFRKYNSIEDSYRDHSNFLKNGPRYAFLFNLKSDDYTGWAKGLKKAGYATNPVYAQKLIEIIEKNNLQLLDQTGAITESIEMETVAIQPKPEAAPDIFVPIVNEKQVFLKDENSWPGNADLNKIIYINETKAIIAPRGTAWLRIAEIYGISLSKLFEFNDIEENVQDILEKDQVVFVQRKKKQGAGIYHLVQRNETLYEIAQMEGIRLESLLKKNNLQKGDVLKSGEKLKLKSK